MRVLLCLCCFLVAAGCTRNQLGNLEASSSGDLSHGPPPRGPYDADLREACGPGGPTDRGEPELRRQPYLQRVSEREAAVLWVTPEVESAALLELRPAEAAGADRQRLAPAPDEKEEIPAGTQHLARASDLEPGTIYCYRLIGADGAWTEWTGFRTAPAAGAGEKVGFAALGDIGKGTGDQRAVREAMKQVPLDLVVITGDVAYEDGTHRQLESYFFDVYEEMLDEIPFFPVAGNHDYKTRRAEPFRTVFALPENGGSAGLERWYSFDWGSTHFVALDTEVLGQEQAEWLERDLAANDLPWTVVYAHRPPYSSGKHGSELDVRATFSPVFERHDVDLVLLGHDHNYERTEPIRGVTYIVTGGGGRGTRPVGTSDFTAFSEAVAHFVYVTVDEDHLTAYAIDATGKLFDSVRLEASRSTAAGGR